MLVLNADTGVSMVQSNVVDPTTDINKVVFGFNNATGNSGLYVFSPKASAEL
jgi:hypothetical protein